MAVSNVNTNRITSLYSGMDTDELVKNALTAQQRKMDITFQAKEKAQWRLDAYKEIYSSVNSLRNNFFSVMGEKSVTKNAAYNVFNATITPNSAISVKAGENALPTSFNIVKATRATAARASAQTVRQTSVSVRGAKELTLPEGKTLEESTVAELREAFGLAEDQGLQFGINGKVFEFDPNTTTMADMKETLAEAGVTLNMTPGAVNAETGATSYTFELSMANGSELKLSNTANGKAFGEDGFFGVREGTHSANIMRSDTIAEALRKNGATEEEIADLAQNGITINGAHFTFDVNKDTLRGMMNTINNDDRANAVFSYSEITGKFSIESAETGEYSRLNLKDNESTRNGLSVFGLTDVEDGTNATVELSDGTVMEESSNQFTRDGITFTIDDNYEATGSENLRVSVEQDFSSTVNAVKQFVSDYNSLIEKLNTYYTEDRNTKYDPLTEEQRDGLSEDEAKKWDEKAKSGILRNDATIGSLLSDLRKSLSVKVDSTGMSIMDLGISTVSWDSGSWKTDQGKLTLDENKLLSKLKEDPTAVQNTFAKVDQNASTTTSGYTTTSTEGFFTRVSKRLTEFSSTMRSDNIGGTTKEIYNYESDYDEMMEKYYTKQEALYLKYAQMEQALAKLQSQTFDLGAMLGMSSR